MSYSVSLSHSHDKVQNYTELLPQIHALIADDAEHLIAALANVSAALKMAFDWLWVGFYWVDEAAEKLVLGPFQGPVACVEITKGRGVCGQAWLNRKVMVVADVNAHPDHIACSSLSQSEIVVPIYGQNGEVVGVLDVDSEHLACFDETDAHYLQLLCEDLTRTLRL